MALPGRTTVLTAVLAIIVGAPLAATAATGAAPAGVASAPSAAGGAFTPGRVVVKYRPGVDRASQVALERGQGASALEGIARLGVKVLEVPHGAEAKVVAALDRSGKVEYVERDGSVAPTGEVTTTDTYFRYQWGLKKTRTSTAWSTTKGAEDVVIAVLDTGVTASADFAGKLLPGYNVLDGTTDVTDGQNHGTGAASVAAAATDNGTGIAAYCWSCRILPVKVMTSTGTMSDVAKGIVWATDRGADVINMSLSGPSASAALQDAVRYATARNVLLVSAAGNSGSSTAVYPAAYPEVIGVAASTSSDTLYSWSNYGTWVDVAAPGDNQSIGYDGDVWGYSGTSSAAPVVAGIAGIALSDASRPTAAQVRSALAAGAVGIGASVRHGRVDAVNTLASLSTSGTTTPSPIAPSVTITSPTPGSTVSGVVDVAGTAASGDSSPVSSVRVSVGGTAVATTGTATWSATVDTSSFPAGTTRISATATTTSGASTTTSIDVTVRAPTSTSEPWLTATTTKVKGSNVAELAWDASIGSPATVRRNDAVVATVRDAAVYRDATRTKGAASFDYQVCGPNGCTARATATW